MERLSCAIPLDVTSLAAAQDEVEGFLAGQGIAPAVRERARLVLEEIVVNLLLHGRFERRLPARLGVAIAADAVLVTLDDAAAPFDPRAAAVDEASEAPRETGGQGLRLVRRLAVIRGYGALPDGWNRLELAFRYG